MNEGERERGGKEEKEKEVKDVKEVKEEKEEEEKNGCVQSTDVVRCTWKPHRSHRYAGQ